MGPTNDDVLPAVITAIRPGRIHIEKVNGPFVFEFKGSPAEYGSGLKLAIERGWLTLDRSGTLGEVHPGRSGSVCLMCNLYSITTNQAAIVARFPMIATSATCLRCRACFRTIRRPSSAAPAPIDEEAE